MLRIVPSGDTARSTRARNAEAARPVLRFFLCSLKHPGLGVTTSTALGTIRSISHNQEHPH